MSVVLHLSDPHFGCERPAVVEALVALAAQQRPDLAVLSGDITQRARRPQFSAARAFVDRLGVPWLAIPGNHDIPLFNLAARVFAPYRAQRAFFGRQTEPVFASADLLAIGVKTTRRWRHKNGQVSMAQIERVAALLRAAAPGQQRLVVVHQPAAVQHAEDEHDRLRNHAPALRRWAEAGADLVLGGHIHLPYVMPVDGLARRLWVVQAGTAVSHRVRAGVPNSVNLIRCGAAAPKGLCVVERWDHSAAAGAFVKIAVHDTAPLRAG